MNTFYIYEIKLTNACYDICRFSSPPRAQSDDCRYLLQSIKVVLMKRSTESLSEKLTTFSFDSWSQCLFPFFKSAFKVAGVETELLFELLLWQLGDFVLKSSLPQKPL